MGDVFSVGSVPVRSPHMAAEDPTTIKTTIGLSRSEWNAARGRAISDGVTIGAYVEALLRLARTDAGVHERAVAEARSAGE